MERSFLIALTNRDAVLVGAFTLDDDGLVGYDAMQGDKGVMEGIYRQRIRVRALAQATGG